MRRWHETVGGLVLCAAVAAACTGIWDAEDLAYTTWLVVEIDGDPVAGEVLLYLDVERAVLLTQPMLGNRNVGRHCARSTSGTVWGPDDHALNFTGFADAGSRDLCAPGMEELHVQLSDALRNNERWESADGRLVLVGSSRVILEGGSD